MSLFLMESAYSIFFTLRETSSDSFRVTDTIPSTTGRGASYKISG